MLKTWDIFNTLIARRCIYPHLIFQILEQRAKATGFTKARMLAEKNLADSGINYNFDDIYKEFEKITNVDHQTCQELKNLECNLELEQCIPITENILQVKSGDILISDMYLSEEIIRKMLLKCGLLVPVEIVITSGGKYSGQIWKQIAAQNQFLFHIGDNPINDVKNSRDAGFDSALTILHQPNVAEKFLIQKDFNFAAYLREIRLRNPYQEEIKRLYWEFFTLNVGILIILVQLIDDLQKKCGFEYLGFCGRDTYYLWLLYKKFKEDIGETPTPSDYLYYSRKLVHTSEDEMAKYFSAKMNNRKALMIDVIGSGTHLNKLREDTGMNYSILICIHDEQKNPYRYKIISQENWISPIKVPDKYFNNDLNFYFFAYEYSKFSLNDSLEHFNRSLHNSPIKLSSLNIDGKFVPNVIFSEMNDSENHDVFESCIKEVLHSKIIWSKFDEKEDFLKCLRQMLIIFKDSVNPILLRSRHQLNEIIDIQTTLAK